MLITPRTRVKGLKEGLLYTVAVLWSKPCLSVGLAGKFVFIWRFSVLRKKLKRKRFAVYEEQTMAVCEMCDPLQ